MPDAVPDSVAGLPPDHPGNGVRISFAPGTLVHTLQGPVAVENLRVGMEVLARDGLGGKPVYCPVRHTLAQLDCSVHAVQILAAGAAEPLTVFATSPDLQPAPDFTGQPQQARFAPGGLVMRTVLGTVGMVQNPHGESPLLVDLRRCQLQPLEAAAAPRTVPVALPEPFMTPVHHFDLGAEHPFSCVGQQGVWLRHTACAAGTSAGNARMAARCFEGDTLVRVEPVVLQLDAESYATKPVRRIDQVMVGDEVLARDEATGEMAYKCVTAVFSGMASACFVTYAGGSGKREGFFVTADHAFRVEGRAWVSAAELQPGDEFLTFNGEKATCVSVKFDVDRVLVYNLEVEAFHTFFVGHEGLWVRAMPAGAGAAR